MLLAYMVHLFLSHLVSKCWFSFWDEMTTYLNLVTGSF